jgi:creatinine amidohydrolase
MKYRLDDLTSAEFKAMQPGNPIILLPMGSTEDQGAHAPMGDFRLASMMAQLIANAASSVGTYCLAAPTVPFGAADHFASAPGAIALRPATLGLVLAEMIQNLRDHGLTRLMVLNGHGGNGPVVHEVTRQVRREGGPIIPSFPLWRVAQRVMERRIGPAPGRFGHGGEPLASIGLALRNPAMRRDLALPPTAPGTMLGLPVTDFGTLGFEDMPINAPVDYDQVAPNSALGDATQADAALGLAVVAEVVAIGARFCVHMASTQA